MGSTEQVVRRVRDKLSVRQWAGAAGTSLLLVVGACSDNKTASTPALAVTTTTPVAETLVSTSAATVTLANETSSSAATTVARTVPASSTTTPDLKIVPSTDTPPEGMCTSPIALSETYPKDPHATKDQKSWTTGVAIEVTLPLGATGEALAFADPGGNLHFSKPAPTTENVFVMAIGNSAVRFGAVIFAEAGSPLCDIAPSVNFGAVQPLAGLNALPGLGTVQF